MNTQKGFALVLILILVILGLSVVGGGAYFYKHPQKAPSFDFPLAPMASSTSQNFSTPSATIDKTSLTSNSANPTITGTFAGLNGLRVVIAKQAIPETETVLTTLNPAVIESSVSDHGGDVNLNATMTAYSSKVYTPLPDGSYWVGVYAKSEKSGGVYTILLTSGTLAVSHVASPAVPGMSKYTDSDFGFSFWYPSGWKIVREDVPLTGTDRAWDVKYIQVGEQITLKVRRPMDDGSFFVEPNVVLIPAARYGETMGNLASYDFLSSFSKTYRTLSVLLNSKIAIFTDWNPGSEGVDLDPRPLLKTIVSTNSTFGVASTAEQIKVIQAEQKAYAGE